MCSRLRRLVVPVGFLVGCLSTMRSVRVTGGSVSGTLVGEAERGEPMMVQAVQRAVRILRELAGSGPRLGVTDLADRLGVAKPTAYALLRTLEGEGLVVQDAETGRYCLGPGLVYLSNAYLDTQELRTRALTWADVLASRADEAVWVAVLSGDQALVVHHAFRPGVRFRSRRSGRVFRGMCVRWGR